MQPAPSVRCSDPGEWPEAMLWLALGACGRRERSRRPYRDGTTRIVLEPLDLMARLAALVPPPRMHLTRYHGVFAPHSRLRAAITPAGRGAGGKGAKQDTAVCYLSGSRHDRNPVADCRDR
jgi:Putative transposase